VLVYVLGMDEESRQPFATKEVNTAPPKREDLKIGDEIGVPIPSTQPSSLVFGRFPETQELKPGDAVRPGEVWVTLLNEQQKKLDRFSASRREVRVTFFPGGRMAIGNLTDHPITWGLSERDKRSIRPGEEIAVPDKSDLRNLRVDFGKDLILHAGSVTGNGQNLDVVQSLNLRRSR
jgi:hypothetical protein